MASDYSSEQDMERALKRHFASEEKRPSRAQEPLGVAGRPSRGSTCVAGLAEDHSRDRQDMDSRLGR